MSVKLSQLEQKDVRATVSVEGLGNVTIFNPKGAIKFKLIDFIKTKMGNKGLEIISSMGMGNKLDPTKIEVTDIHKTTICPLARVMRKELKDRKIKKLKVVYSTEQPKELKKKILNGKKVTPGSVSFVPSVGGLIIASVVINDLLNKK